MKKLFLLYFIAGLLLAGCQAKQVTVSGRLSVAGSEPFTYLRVITENNQRFKIVGDYKKELQAKYQQQQITVKGYIIKEASGPGFPAEIKVLEFKPVIASEL